MHIRNTAKALIAAFASLMILITTLPTPVSALETHDASGFISFVNSSIDVRANRIDLDESRIMGFVNSHKTQIISEYPKYANYMSRFVSDMSVIIRSINKELEHGTLLITPSGRLVSKEANRRERSADYTLEWFWWGTRRTFYSDQQARNFAGEMDKAVIISNLAGIGALLFPGMAIPAGLSSAYAQAVANSVRWAADQPGNGVILDTTFLLTYTAVPRR